MDERAESMRSDGRPALERDWLVSDASCDSDELLKEFASQPRAVAGMARRPAVPATTVNARSGVRRRATAARMRLGRLVVFGLADRRAGSIDERSPSS